MILLDDGEGRQVGRSQLALFTELLVQCLADPGCEGSEQVLAEVMRRRHKARPAAVPGAASVLQLPQRGDTGRLLPPCHPAAALCGEVDGDDRLVLTCASCGSLLLVIVDWTPHLPAEASGGGRP